MCVSVLFYVKSIAPFNSKEYSTSLPVPWGLHETASDASTQCNATSTLVSHEFWSSCFFVRENLGFLDNHTTLTTTCIST